MNEGSLLDIVPEELIIYFLGSVLQVQMVFFDGAAWELGILGYAMEYKGDDGILLTKLYDTSDGVCKVVGPDVDDNFFVLVILSLFVIFGFGIAVTIVFI